MELRQLRYFVATVDAGSVSAGARRIGIAQPALSQQLARLESALGARLLDRSRLGIVPTDAGNALYRQAEIMLRLADETREVIRRARTEVGGRVRLGLSALLAARFAAALVTRVRAQVPGVSLEVHEHLIFDQLLALMSDDVDLSIVAHVDEAESGIEIEPLVAERQVLVRRRVDGAPPLPAVMALDDVVRLTLVMPAGTPAYRDAIARALGRKPPLAVATEAGSAQIMTELIADGVGPAFVPPSVFAWHRRAAELEYCAVEPPVERVTAIARQSLYPPTVAAQRVRTIVEALFRERIVSGEWPGARWIAPRA